MPKRQSILKYVLPYFPGFELLSSQTQRIHHKSTGSNGQIAGVMAKNPAQRVGAAHAHGELQTLLDSYLYAP